MSGMMYYSYVLLVYFLCIAHALHQYIQVGPTELNKCLLEFKQVPTGSKQQMEAAPSTGSPLKTDYWQKGATRD